jgi:hypothetical protein
MRKALLLLSLVSVTAFGCASATTTHVASDATLGRVVIYRNGIAYFERTAEVEGQELALRVPADKVDDFLKSLTVVDAETGKAAPIAYPTTPPGDESGTVTMKIQLGQVSQGAKPRKLRLSYVTEAPSWKPSYRIVLGEGGKVRLEGWAIVDNTSGEDWESVKLGVGSSSALSFRFDLHSVRLVHRETLAASDLFAQAPPTGLTRSPADDERGLAVLDLVDEETLNEAQRSRKTASAAEGKKPKAEPTSDRSAPRQKPITAATGGLRGGRDGGGVGYGRAAEAPMGVGQVGVSAGEQRIVSLAQRVQSQNKTIVVEGIAAKGDADKNGAALERANKLREELIANGVAPEQVVAMANTSIVSEGGGARVLEAPPPPPAKDQAASGGDTAEPSGAMLDPIGTSHFESTSPMTVKRGSSAMVSILASDTAGEVVYLYDAESQRGNTTYPFRAVRLVNPTESTLETGPVTVFGQGRFIGEGLTEPIPGKSTSFIPYALDRQILVESEDGERESIARILTVQRGVLSSEVKHVRKKKLVLRNRLAEPATVYLRHTVKKGYKLLPSSAKDAKPAGDATAAVRLELESAGKLGEATLFRVTIPAGSAGEVLIEEETPVYKTVDLRSPSGMGLVKLYLDGASLEGPLVDKLRAMVELHRELGNLEERIATQREQLGEYRMRMDELHAQIVTLKLVKTAGPLLKNLEKKMIEISDRVSKATVDLVGLEEQRMITRIKLQDGLAELSLEKPVSTASAKN